MKIHISAALPLLLLLAGCGTKVTQQRPQPHNPIPSGKQVALAVTGQLVPADPKMVPVSADEKTYEQLLITIIKKEPTQQASIVASGKVFLVPVGTKAEVIGQNAFGPKIRILEGEHSGKTGWVPTEWTK